MHFNDYLTKLFSVLSVLNDVRFLTLFSVIGFIALQRRVWGQALCILLFSMILNASLKNFFHIPLLPHLGKQGFAFPSGHMTAAVAFYGWLLICYGNLFIRSFLLIILIGIAYRLIDLHYHTLFDVLGAVGFGGLTLFLYYHCTKTSLLHKHPPLIGLFLSLLAVPILFYLPQIPPHIWMAFEGLLGFSLLWTVFHLSART